MTKDKTPTALVVVATVDGKDITVPDLTARQQAALEAMKQYSVYKNMITCEAERIWLTNSVLMPLKERLNAVKKEVKSILDPLAESRRLSLAASKKVENAFAGIIAGDEAAERIVKDELVRWHNVQEQKRLAEENDLRRKAEEEQRRLESEARKEAEAAALKNLEEQQRAAELERKGRQEEADKVRAEADAQLEAASESVLAKQEEADAVVDNVHVVSESVKLKGSAITGKWIAEVADVFEVFAGLVDKSTPPDAVRVKHQGKLKSVNMLGLIKCEEIEGIEINLPWFNEQARKQEKSFNYRGMRARFVQDLRVTA